MSTQTGGDYKAARAISDELFQIARRLDDPALLLQAHHSAWATALWKPELQAVVEHTKQGLALYDPDKHRAHAVLYGGHDAGVCCHGIAGYAQWLLGYPDQAARSQHQGIRLAETLSHPTSLAHALFSAGMTAYFRRDSAEALSYSERALSIAEEHRLAAYAAFAHALRGWALVEHGQAEGGLIELRQGLDALVATRVKNYSGCLRNALVESYARADDIQAALAASEEAIEAIAGGADHFWEADALRVRGDVLVASQRHNEAEVCLDQAIRVAREQGARSLELRAAASLARLWRDQGRHLEARDLVAPIYGWFREGFGTSDLKNAKMLLAELGA